LAKGYISEFIYCRINLKSKDTTPSIPLLKKGEVVLRNQYKDTLVSDILILYYSRHGATEKLAQLIARGVEKVPNMQARLRTVPEISASCEKTSDEIPDNGSLYVSDTDLQECSGLILGSPTRFGNMASPLKYFIDSTSSQWLSGALNAKPAGVFTSSSSQHGGQESTLLTMMIPLLHHGMIISGIPYSESTLSSTTTGGTPYGASHIAGSQNNNPISDDEKKLAIALGSRIANLAAKLN
jgi:NAD(P)H dehydrogenase (quinone)